MTLSIDPNAVAFKAHNGPFALAELSASRNMHSDAALSNYAQGEEVIGEGDVADNYYLVVKGVFRSVKVTRDGRRQIFAFYMPGDLCGLEPGGRYEMSVEAVNPATIATLPRRGCRARMNRDPQFNTELFEGATRALAQSVDHMTMIGRSSAEERLAWFLLMLRDRASAPGRNPAVVDLVMQRQDIADYLGLTIETVSRTFTLLKERGLIALPATRRVEIRKVEQLERLAAADRDAPIWDARRIA